MSSRFSGKTSKYVLYVRVLPIRERLVLRCWPGTRAVVATPKRDNAQAAPSYKCTISYSKMTPFPFPSWPMRSRTVYFFFFPPLFLVPCRLRVAVTRFADTENDFSLENAPVPFITSTDHHEDKRKTNISFFYWKKCWVKINSGLFRCVWIRGKKNHLTTCAEQQADQTWRRRCTFWCFSSLVNCLPTFLLKNYEIKKLRNLKKYRMCKEIQKFRNFERAEIYKNFLFLWK